MHLTRFFSQWLCWDINWHTIKFAVLSVQLSDFGIFVKSCDHHHNPILEHFWHSRKIHLTHLWSLSFHFQSSANINLLSSFEDFIFNISYSWNRIIPLFGTGFFQLSMMFLKFFHVIVYLYFISLSCWIIACCMEIMFYLSIHQLIYIWVIFHF